MKPVLRRGLAACLAALPLSLLLSAPAASRAQGGPPPPGASFGAPPPEPAQQFQAWDKWRKSHPNVEAVSRTLRGVEALELGRPGFGGRPGEAPNAATQLNAAQARKMLLVLRSWQGKPVMTDAQAASVNKELLKLLNPAQKTALGAERGFGGRGGRPGLGGPPQGGTGGPPMPPPPGQGRWQSFNGGPNGRPGGNFRTGGFAMPAPHDYNPLNPATNPMTFMRDRAGQRFSALLSRLAATR